MFLSWFLEPSDLFRNWIVMLVLADILQVRNQFRFFCWGPSFLKLLCFRKVSLWLFHLWIRMHANLLNFSCSCSLRAFQEEVLFITLVHDERCFLCLPLQNLIIDLSSKDQSLVFLVISLLNCFFYRMHQVSYICFSSPYC